MSYKQTIGHSSVGEERTDDIVVPTREVIENIPYGKHKQGSGGHILHGNQELIEPELSIHPNSD